MLKEINFSEYLKLQPKVPLIDVRSPGEYQKGHIPGAINIPLFSNDERAHVGTVYKKQSKEKAIEIGYNYVKPKLEWFITETKKIVPLSAVAIHCWRGGMRSKSFAKHLKENNFKKVFTLKGGYKAFRNFVLDSFNTKANIVLLGGFTGSGKTKILQELKHRNEQVIDLEKTANHKGSAFGGIGNGGQPTIEQFENNLFWEWKELNYSKPIWIEDESHRIGLVNIPMNLYKQMLLSKVIFIEVDINNRAENLIADYANYNKNDLANSIQRISKRLGGADTKLALEMLEKDNFFEVAKITLKYYDKYYLKGLRKKDPNNVFSIKINKINTQENTNQVIKYYESVRNKNFKTYAI